MIKNAESVDQSDKPSPGNRTLTGETARGSVVNSPPPILHSEGGQAYFQIAPASLPSGLLSQEPNPRALSTRKHPIQQLIWPCSPSARQRHASCFTACRIMIFR